MRLQRLLTAVLAAMALGFGACGTFVGSNPSGAPASGASGASSASTASLGRVQNPPPPDPSGTIEGSVGYPAGADPPLVVYAVDTDRSRFYFVVRASYGLPVVPPDQEWYEYRLERVAPGDYFVLATRRDVALSWQTGYTKFVQCGNTVACAGTPHTLLPVHVSAGSTVSGIDPSDSVPYFAVPNAGLPALDLAAQPTTFPDLTQASASVGHDQGADVQRVDSTANCPVNVVCAVLTGEHDGHESAYFTYELGTNGLFRTCASYFLNDATGWQHLEWHCPRLTTAFPAVGSSGQLAFPPFSFETGCINIHSAPGLTAKVVACLPAGTGVTIDDGPYYLPETTSPTDLTKNLWWHVANEGWVVHRYVEASP